MANNEERYSRNLQRTWEFARSRHLTDLDEASFGRAMADERFSRDLHTQLRAMGVSDVGDYDSWITLYGNGAERAMTGARGRCCG